MSGSEGEERNEGKKERKSLKEERKEGKNVEVDHEETARGGGGGK